MATFILKWNPAISSFKLEDFHITYKDFPFGPLNWSVWDYKQAHSGDEFYMVRVGAGNTGVVMRGIFSSDPIKGKDWSGKGRETYYCDLSIDYIVDSETMPIITTADLEVAIPDFEWSKGHSGVLLSYEQSKRLNSLFEQYAESNPKIIEWLSRAKDIVIQESSLETIKGKELWAKLFDLDKNDPNLYTDYATHDSVNLSFSYDYTAFEYKLSVLFHSKKMLHIICRKLYKIKTDLSSSVAYMHEFKLTKPYTDAYVLESNGIEIICGEIEFEKITDYDYDMIPVTI